MTFEILLASLSLIFESKSALLFLFYADSEDYELLRKLLAKGLLDLRLDVYFGSTAPFDAILVARTSFYFSRLVSGGYSALTF